ncbi:MAG: glycoside hydrolase family 97 N-terminal domain-containing protein, partial [Paludibacter sp.]
MNNLKVAVGLICLAIFTVSCSKKCEVNVISPDGTIRIEAGVEDGKPFYSVAKDKAVVIEKSFLGFLLQNNDVFYSDFELIDTKFRSVSDEWEQPWGEDRVVKNTFNETVLMLQQKTGAKRKLNIVFRAFNDGIGFRYEFPEQENLKDLVIMDEITEFAVVGNPQSWSIPTNRTNYFENLYTKKQLTELDTVSTPLTM